MQDNEWSNNVHLVPRTERAQTMKEVPDRKRLRREYLRRKATAEINGYVGLLICFIGLLFVVVAVVDCVWDLVCIVGCLIFLHCLPDHSICERLSPDFILLAVLGAATRYSARSFPKALDYSANLVYVPSVTADTLPADEILVRGADVPPVAHGEVLLRAVLKGEETPQGELLRASTKID